MVLNSILIDPFPDKLLKKRTRLAIFARLLATPTIDMMTSAFAENAILPRAVTYREDCFCFEKEQLQKEVAWYHPSSDLIVPLLKKKLGEFQKLPHADRPASLILVPKFKSRLQYLYARYHVVTRIKAFSSPFQVFRNGHLSDLPPTEVPYLVLSSLPLPTLRERARSLSLSF